MGERHEPERLSEGLEQLLEDLWRVPRFSGARSFRPAIDVFRTDDPPELSVVVDLAGVDPEKVHVVLDERTLLVAGERPRAHPASPRSYYRLEVQYGSFERRITFSEAFDPKAARAQYERGLLTIVLPLAERPARARRTAIPVRRRP